MSRKTNINNLNILWQGQSWSVIAPNGDVIGRFKEKQDAIRFADVTSDYLKTDSEDRSESVSSLSFEENFKPTHSGFDGELKADEVISLPPVPDMVFEKSKRTPRSAIHRLLNYKWSLVTPGILLIVVISDRSFVVNLTRITSNVFSAQNIFAESDTVPFLGLVAVFVPFVLLALNELLSGTMRNLLGIPLTLVGILGLVGGLIVGIVYFVISIFSADYDIKSVIIVVLLWLWISFCAAFLGAKILTKE